MISVVPLGGCHIWRVILWLLMVWFQQMAVAFPQSQIVICQWLMVVDGTKAVQMMILWTGAPFEL